MIKKEDIKVGLEFLLPCESIENAPEEDFAIMSIQGKDAACH